MVASFHLTPSIYGFPSLSPSPHPTDSSTWPGAGAFITEVTFFLCSLPKLSFDFFICLHVFVSGAADGALFPETKAPAPAPARSRPQTPSTLAAARDSSGGVKRAHSWAPPQSPSNSRRCFGFGLDGSRCSPTGATCSQLGNLPVSKTEPFPRNTANSDTWVQPGRATP